jgi:hypothetical protein
MKYTPFFIAGSICAYSAMASNMSAASKLFRQFAENAADMYEQNRPSIRENMKQAFSGGIEYINGMGQSPAPAAIPQEIPPGSMLIPQIQYHHIPPSHFPTQVMAGYPHLNASMMPL